MQQRLLQLVQRGEFLLVEGFEALGFFVQHVDVAKDFPLNIKRWQMEPQITECNVTQIWHYCTTSKFLKCLSATLRSQKTYEITCVTDL